MKNIYLLVCLFLLVSSCQKEYIQDEINGLSLKDRFDPELFKDIVPYAFMIDWNAGNEVSLHGFDSVAVEYPIIFTAALTPQTLNIKSDLSFKLMVISNNEDPEFYINKYVDLGKSYSEDLNQFTGNIQTLDEHGEILASRWYDQGLFLSDLKNPESSPDSGLIQQRMALNRSYIIVRTLMTTDWYTEDGGGGWRKTHTTNNGYREEVIWNQDDYYLYEFWARSGAVDTSRGGGNGPYGTTYTGITSREEATIKKIEDRHGFAPSCKAFEYSNVIKNEWQVAATKNIVALIGYYDIKTGDFNTSHVIFPQPIYFEMPITSASNGGYISPGRAAKLTALALNTAINRAKYYFLSTNASSSQVQAKLWEYIRDEMTNGAHIIGGKASFTPPLGFKGQIKDYESFWFIEDNCD